MFDPARLPAPVRDRLAIVGYWACGRDLRDKVDHWDVLDDPDRRAAEKDLELLGSALARP